jgi:hypothetical protein
LRKARPGHGELFPEGKEKKKSKIKKWSKNNRKK